MDIESYLVEKETHVGFLRRDLKQNSIIEWIPEAIVLRIDGEVIPASESVLPDKAMHQLKGLIGTDKQVISLFMNYWYANFGIFSCLMAGYSLQEVMNVRFLW